MALENRRAMPTPAAVDRFAVLSVRRGLSLGALHSANKHDFAVVLAAAAQAFSAAREWSEREINDLLRAFLADAGAMLETDHVELRRWLVDFHLLERDGYGRVYIPGAPAAEIAELAAELAGVDLAAVAREARARDALRRAERKVRWQTMENNSRG